MVPEKKAKKDDTGLGCACLGLTAILFAVACYYGSHHGWNHHDGLVPVPFLSGPSDEEIQRSFSSSGINGAEVIDRWPEVQSDGGDKVRKGITLYPLRVRYRYGTTPLDFDFYFYYDDFGELRYFPKSGQQ